MVIQYLSDIHCETHADRGDGFCHSLDPTGVDVLVIAGDFCSWKTNHQSRQLFGILAQKYPQIVYVPGNHEFWGTDALAWGGRFRNLERTFPNVTVLDNEAALVSGQLFVGGTMWFPEPPFALSALKLTWVDYRAIKNFVPWVEERNAGFTKLLRDMVNRHTVVVTHHQPSWKSVHPRYERDVTNCFYVTDQEAVIHELKPRLWIHGHTHEQFDYTLDETRVVCNPHGRFGELYANEAFQPRALITL